MDRCSHITATVCKHIFITRVIQFVCTHRRSNETTSFEKELSISYISLTRVLTGTYILVYRSLVLSTIFFSSRYINISVGNWIRICFKYP